MSELDERRARIDELNHTAWELGLHEPERAKTLATKALTLAQRAGYPHGEALAIRTLGYSKLLQADFKAALEESSRAAEALRELGDESGEASALNSVAIAFARLGDFDKALEHTLRCLELNQAVGDRRGEAWAFTELGNVHLDVRELPQAREKFEKALAIFEELDYKPGLGRVWTLLGSVALSMDDEETALRCYETSLAFAREDDLRLSISANASSVGRVYQSMGEREKARRFFEEALEIAEQTPLDELKAGARLSLGRLELDEGNYARAQSLLEEGLRLIEGGHSIATECQLREALSQLFEQLDRPADALAHYKAFHALRDAMFDEEGRARLKNLQIRMGVEKAQKDAEIERLRFVELAGMQAELVQSEKMALLGRLVAGLSHEINTPIGVINSNASLAERALEILRSDGAWPGGSRAWKAMDSLENAHRTSAQAGARLAELVQSLQGYARLDKAELQRVDIADCVRESIELFETQLPEEIRVEKRIRSLPEVTCRPGQLNQVFMTLLVNAHEAIDGAGTISVDCREDRGWMSVGISDTGRGIPSERLASLFDIDFSRKDSQVRLRMGLSNAKSVVEKHGGEIAVESTVGRGTSFHVRLPLEVRPVPFFGGGWARPS